jgi:3'-5' exoribonuclease
MTPKEKIQKMALEFTTKDYNVNKIAAVVYSRPKFDIWTGSSKPEQHHYGKGGLARHTLEVIESSLMMHEYYQTSEPLGKIFLAALFHDFGKFWDYKPIIGADPSKDYHVWGPTEHKNKIHHLPKSAIEWCKAVLAFQEFRPWEDDITHAILSHHGLREWGSPVQPKTKLAWILHLCDNMSARVYES